MKGSGAYHHPGRIRRLLCHLQWAREALRPTSGLEKSQANNISGCNFQTTAGRAVSPQAALGSCLILLFSETKKADGGARGPPDDGRRSRGGLCTLPSLRGPSGTRGSCLTSSRGGRSGLGMTTLAEQSREM